MTGTAKKHYVLIFVTIAAFTACNVMTLKFSGSYRIPTQDDIEGFFVQDGKLYDANGNIFQMRGVNANHNWNASARDNDEMYLDAIRYMKATGVNAVRAVFGPTRIPENEADPEEYLKWHYTGYTTALRKNIVEEYIRYHIVPVVEYHNATGFNNPERVFDACRFWIGEKEWLDEYARYVILNITNEWGRGLANENETDYAPGSSPEEWFNTYKKAITWLRREGIKNLLVIDAFNYGSSLQSVLDYGQELLDHDPMHNVLFSIHSYGGWYSSKTDPSKITNSEKWWLQNTNWNADYALNLLEEKKLPVIFGEFSANCARIDANAEAAPDTELIADFDAHGAGWLFWMWHNWNAGAQVQMMNLMNSFSYSKNGLPIADRLKGSPEASVFSNDPPVPALPTLGQSDPDYDPGTATINNLIVGAEDLVEIVLDRALIDPDPDLIPDHMDMEIQNSDPDDTSMYWLLFRGWKWAYGTRELEPADFMGKTVRFWIYTPAGSVARTEWGIFDHGNQFAIDHSY